MSDRPLRNNHPILQLFNQLMPNSLINIFRHYKIGSRKIKPFLFPALAVFYKYLDTNIWKIRNVHFKNYKHTNNINKGSFKDYCKNNPSRKQTTDQQQNARNNKHHRYQDLQQQINILNHVTVLDPTDEWIVWTSSNFLHNGPLEACIYTEHLNTSDGASP